jgi:integrase
MFPFDIWDIRILGLKPNNDREITLNFTKINPDWLKFAFKKWIQYRSSTMQSGTLINNLTEIKVFSAFLEERYPQLKPQSLNRGIIVDYLIYLSEHQYSTSHRKGCLVTLRQFLECCSRFGYAEVPKEGLIFKEDIPKRVSKIPRFIPPNVIKQLEEHIDVLPKPIICMVKVIRETGMRVSELCNLKFNCIRQDSTGGWWIDYYQLKMQKEHTVNITRDLAVIIQQQQEYIRGTLGAEFPYLFCEAQGYSCFHEYLKEDPDKRFMKGTRKPKELNFFAPLPKKMISNTLRGYLHKLAEEKQIIDDSGKIFPLGKCHQFRHTHGTELINNGVPQHIVQKRLGHVSPEMTMHYAHIHDKTMKQEMEKFWDGKVVDIRGEVVISENPDLDTAEMQWIKKNMKAQALPNGFCGLPVTQSCPVQGSPCLVCSHFRTTKEHVETHKKQLKNTENIIKNATAKGWHRQVETNEPIAQNLRNIIQGIEGDVNNA